VTLPELPLAQWEATKTTIHLWAQIVGKMRMGLMPRRNHWWHAPLYVDVRGLTTRRMRAPDDVSFQIDFDFVEHRLHVRTVGGTDESFPLHDGLSVAEFDQELHALLAKLGLDLAIKEEPFGLPFTTSFPDDRDHASYDPEAVVRFWRILDWSDSVFDEFSGWFSGKTSPVHLFWHSLDLAVSRYAGPTAPVPADLDPVNREAYSHEVIAFGFWAGDEQSPEPSFYSYTSPEPNDLHARTLEPGEARWTQRGAGSLALLPYDAVRTAPDPRAKLLTFLDSTYEAGAHAAGWPIKELESSWHPRSSAQVP
jgi:Family of unknown function (DUF5996)